MKTSILIASLVCALSIRMELTEALRPKGLVKLLNQVEHESFVFDEPESTLTIADLFYEIRKSRKILGSTYTEYEQDLERARNYLSKRHTWKYLDTHLLRLMDFISSVTKADISFWSSLIESSNTRSLSIREVDKFYDLRTNSMLAAIFEPAFKTRMLSPELDPGSIIKAIINGSGFCDLFKHPSDDFSKDIDASNERLVEFAKLCYLLSEIRTQKVALKVDENTSPTLTADMFSSMEIVCSNLIRAPLDNNQRKQFLNSMLALDLEFRNIIVPISNVQIFGRSSIGTNFCFKLEQLMHKRQEFSQRFKFPQTRSIFIDECLSDIAKDLQPNGRDADGTMLDRWQDMIMQFAIEGNENFGIGDILARAEHFKIDLQPPFNDEFDKVLKGLITEYPTTRSKLTYERGEGICNMLYNSRCDAIYKTLWRVIVYLPADYSLERLFVNISQLSEILLSRFFLMRLVCNNIRQTITTALRQQLSYAQKYVKLEYDKAYWQIFKASLVDRWIERISEFVSNETQSNMKAVVAIFSSNLELSALLHPKLNPKYRKYLQLVVDELPASQAVLAFNEGKGICKDLLGVKIFVRLLSVFERMHEVWSSGQEMDIFYSQPNKELMHFGLVIETCYFLRAN